jgi:asparagine synthetase B (glutamine-hydrolysing)
MGMRACYLQARSHADAITFATEIKQLLVVPGVPSRVDELGMVGHPRRALPPPGPHAVRERRGSYRLELRRSRRCRRTSLVDAGGARIPRDRRCRCPMTPLTLPTGNASSVAVADRLATSTPVGVSLSGGVDSTNLASLAGWLKQRGQVTAPDLHAYAWGFVDVRGRRRTGGERPGGRGLPDRGPRRRGRRLLAALDATTRTPVLIVTIRSDGPTRRSRTAPWGRRGPTAWSSC